VLQHFFPTHYTVAEAAHLSLHPCCILKCFFCQNHLKITKKNVRNKTINEYTKYVKAVDILINKTCKKFTLQFITAKYASELYKENSLLFKQTIRKGEAKCKFIFFKLSIMKMWKKHVAKLIITTNVNKVINR